MTTNRSCAVPNRALRAAASGPDLSSSPRGRLQPLAEPVTPGYADSPSQVLVLGAGMAGLTAALALHRRGHEVTVIEYQNRVGGRLYSIPLSAGQFSEAGAGHFRANMAQLLQYVLRFDLPIISMNDGLTRYLVDGLYGDGSNLGAWPWDLPQRERNLTIATTLSRYLMLSDLDHESVIANDWPDPETLKRLDPLTLGDLIRHAGGSEMFFKLLSAHGGRFIDAPALMIQADLAYHFGEQALFRIAGGNQRLPQAMAGELGERVVLDAPVVLIDHTGPKVRVVTRNGREFTGDAVVSTIPFSVLPEVDVRPAWSAGKKRMIESMAWGTAIKLVVETRSPVWLTKGAHGWPMAGSDRPWERLIDITGNEPGGHGNAFFYLNGPNAAAYRAMPAATREREMLALFEADMPGMLGEVIHTQSFDWVDQPWIKGSWGIVPPGAGWMIDEWTRPEGRLHFAGDFTSFKTGWVEGAIESGLRAAQQIDPLAPAEAPSRKPPA